MDEKNLTRAHLERHPVWKWNDSQDAHCQVTNFEPLPDDEPTLFIKSEFETSTGEKFDGYLVGAVAFYAFALFVGSGKFLFNLNVPEMAVATSAKLAAALGREDFILFPLRYHADFHFEGEHNIEGTFMV